VRAGLGVDSAGSGGDHGSDSAADHGTATAGVYLAVCSVGGSVAGCAISSGGGHHACYPVLGDLPGRAVACLATAACLVPAEEGSVVACS
jgi:hypothetical protein